MTLSAGGDALVVILRGGVSYPLSSLVCQYRDRVPKARSCVRCRTPLPEPAGTGRPRRYCSTACRKAAYRRRVSKPGRAARADWWTPAALAERMRSEHHLGLDAAACERSTLVADNWLGPTHPESLRRDALAYDEWAELTPYGTTVWVNPPYAPQVLAQFLTRAAATADAGTPVVALVPASTGTNWWHQSVVQANADVEFLRGRLVFGGPHSTGGPAPWPSALVTYQAR